MKIYNGYLNNLRESYFVCIFATLKVEKNASVAELVDALDSKSCSFGSAGSIPARGTKALEFSRAFLFPFTTRLSGLCRFSIGVNAEFYAG